MVFVQEEFASIPNMLIDQQNQPIREASGLSPNTNQSPPSINQQEQPQQEQFVTASSKDASPDDHDTTSEFFDEEESIDQAFFESFPPGYRFCPTDSELIVYYLRKKIAREVLPPNQIRHVNLYRHSPDRISERYPPIGEKEWYFFTPRDRKYRNGSRPNRAAGSGYWKATGADKPVKYNGALFGFRKALVFYEGKPPKGVKSNWIMHEYRVNEPMRKKTCPADMRLDDFVLCRIYKKTDKAFKSQPPNGIPENVDQNDYQTPEKNEGYDQYNAYPSDIGNNIDPGRIDRELNAIEASAGFVQPQFDTRCSEVHPMMDTTLANYYKYVNSNFQTPQNYGANSVVYRGPNSGENACMLKYPKEGASDIKSGGGIQENLWLKDYEHYNLPPELDFANTMDLPDLENILDNPPPISFEKSNNPFDIPPVSKRS